MNLDKVIKIRVCGRNIDNYIKRIIKRKINFIEVIPVSKNEVYIILRVSDYLELIKYKSVLYEVSIVEKKGILKLKENYNTNKILLLFMVFGFVLIYGLSNMIFKVDVIHHDKNIRDLIYKELDKYEIVKYSFKKSYFELEEIEDKILKSNKDVLEWLEINVNGTFVTVRVEERILNDEDMEYQYQDIVSKKDSVITSVKASSGVILKEKGMYVKEGEVVISGSVVHPNNSSVLGMAIGEVYGEVWYEVDIDYPFVYQESNLTGRSKKGIALNFFDKKINLFGKGNYKSFASKNKVLFRDNFLKLEVIKEKRYEMNIKDEVYTEELVETKAINYIKDKMMRDNPDIREISKVEVMSRNVDYDGISFKFFVTTIESIGMVKKVEESKMETME